MEEKEIYESTDINKDESLDDIYQKFLVPESPKKIHQQKYTILKMMTKMRIKIKILK